MDTYLFSLYIGFGGLLLMTLLGLAHHTGGGRGHGSAHTGNRGHHSHQAHAHSARSGHAASLRDNSLGFILTMLSPRLIFSLLMGFGAAGVLLRPFAAHWPLFLLPVVAALDAGAFERCVVQPFWRLLFGFASTPAQTLGSIVQTQGQAVTNFDATGTGLIAVDLDGQVRQLLGSLSPEDRVNGDKRVRSGDSLRIEAVDLQRNSCTVSRLS